MSYQFKPFADREGDGSGESTDRTAFRTTIVSLAEFFYPLYRFVFANQEDFVDKFDQKMREANINTTTEVYLSGAFAVGSIIGTVFAIAMLAVAYSVIVAGGMALPTVQYDWFPSVIRNVIVMISPSVIGVLSLLKVPVVLLFAGAMGALLGLAFGGGTGVLIPYLRARDRNRQIGLVFPDAVGMMYSLAEGGSDQITVFEKVANSEDAYGELSVEFQRIVRETELYQEDYETAMRRVARDTPNEELEKFLTDMLGILNSGGSFKQYLTEAKERQKRERKRKQEGRLRMLEALGQTYITLQIAPMLGVIMLVVMAMVGSPHIGLLIAIVYFGIPTLNGVFGLLIAGVKIDEPGDGYMEINGEVPNTAANELSVGPASNYRGDGDLFDQVWRNQAKHRIGEILRDPFAFFREEPDYTLLFSIPLATLTVFVLLASGRIDPSMAAFIDRPVQQTIGFFFAPFYIIILPYLIMYEWGSRIRGGITATLAADLRKLANTNQTGQPFHESLRITVQDSDTRFGEELGIIYKKLTSAGIPIDRGLVEFNNKYHIPRLARTVKIIEKAQEVSSEITEVLQTAAEAAEIQEELKKEQETRTMMQVIVVIMSFLVFLAILAGMKIKLIDMVINIIGSDPAWPNFQSVNPRMLGVLFFHAALIQGVTSGIIAGYVQSNDPRAGLKFSALNGTLALIVWILIA